MGTGRNASAPKRRRGAGKTEIICRRLSANRPLSSKGSGLFALLWMGAQSEEMRHIQRKNAPVSMEDVWKFLPTPL